MCQALKEIMRPDFEEEIKESFNEGFQKGQIHSRIKTYYECGVTPEDIAKKISCSVEYANEVLGKY